MKEPSRMQAYEHKQFSPWIVLGIAVVTLAFLLFAFSGNWIAGKIAAFVFVVIITLPFVSLSTRVDARGIAWSFTLGFPSGFITFPDIADVQITRTNFWEGFGIHWTIWHGWLWNVAGYGAVMVHKRNGSVITIGTDDPQRFYDAIGRHSSSSARPVS